MLKLDTVTKEAYIAVRNTTRWGSTISAPELQKKKDFFVASSIKLPFPPNFYRTCGSFLKYVLSFFHIFE